MKQSTSIFLELRFVFCEYVIIFVSTKQYEKSVMEQEGVNEELKIELMKEYKIIDSIGDDTKKITLYLNENLNKLIVELKMEDTINYGVIEAVRKNFMAKEEPMKCI